MQRLRVRQDRAVCQNQVHRRHVLPYCSSSECSCRSIGTAASTSCTVSPLTSGR